MSQSLAQQAMAETIARNAGKTADLMKDLGLTLCEGSNGQYLISGLMIQLNKLSNAIEKAGGTPLRITPDFPGATNGSVSLLSSKLSRPILDAMVVLRCAECNDQIEMTGQAPCAT